MTEMCHEPFCHSLAKWWLVFEDGAWCLSACDKHIHSLLERNDGQAVIKRIKEDETSLESQIRCIGERQLMLEKRVWELEHKHD